MENKTTRREMLTKTGLAGLALAGVPITGKFVHSDLAENDDEKPIDMGLGKIGQPNMTFVRKFRFTIGGEHLEVDFNCAVDINYTKRIIKLSAYELLVDGIIPIQSWVEAMEARQYPNETLTFITYDGCGREIYRKVFSGLMISNRESNFDYSSSDVSTQDITIAFDKCTNVEKKNESKKFPTKETVVDHLNGRVFLMPKQ